MPSKPRQTPQAPDGVPANVHAEQVVIGAVLAGYVEFRSIPLTRGDFSLDKHRRIWLRMSDLDRRGEPIDYELLAEELLRNEELDLVDGISYLTDLNRGSSKKFDGYVAAIREKTDLRRLIKMSKNISDRAFEQQKPDQILADVLGEVRTLQGQNGRQGPEQVVLAYSQLMEKETPMEKTMFDTFPVPAHGLTLMVGAAKAGKSVLATQVAASVATGRPLFDKYRVEEKGPVLIVERDDPKGPVALKSQLVKLAGSDPETPIYTTGSLPEGFGPAMAEWLEAHITKLGLKLVMLDSYTALRAERKGSSDIVRLERVELEMLDDVGKRLGCAIVLIHHGSKSAADLDWTMSASGSFAMFAGAEALCHVSRFQDCDSDPERLVRIRGRHSSDLYLALRFQKETLSYEYVLEGAAAPLFPLLRKIQAEFLDAPFTVKALMDETGFSRTHAYRQLDRLKHAGAVTRHVENEYALIVKV